MSAEKTKTQCCGGGHAAPPVNTVVGVSWPQDGGCPHCGRCPCCGRPYGNFNYPAPFWYSTSVGNVSTTMTITSTLTQSEK